MEFTGVRTRRGMGEGVGKGRVRGRTRGERWEVVRTQIGRGGD